MFPPILNSSQAAMTTNTEYNIYFSFPNTLTINSIDGLEMSVVNQVNNKNLVKNGNFIKYDASEIYDENGMYYIKLSNLDIINGGLKEEEYYKIQLAFTRDKEVSEWSTVMIIKIIKKPEIKILNDNTNFTDLKIESGITYEQSKMPLFIGQFIGGEGGTEYVDQYRFILKQNGVVYCDSGWTQHNSEHDTKSNNTSIDQWYPQKELPMKDANDNQYNYTLEYYIKTQNLYENSAKEYDFRIANTYVGAIPDGIDFKFVDYDKLALEEGLVSLYLKISDNEMSSGSSHYGNYILLRQKVGDPIIEELVYFQITESNLEKYLNKFTLFYEDFTVESGEKYVYTVQKINMYGLRSPTKEVSSLKSDSIKEAQIYLEYSYLYCNDIQLKLKYDNKMNSFKHTNQAAKQDTLGSRFATIVKNSQSNYAEFPINALISINLDENRKFLKTDGLNLKYKDEIIAILPEVQINREGNTELPTQFLGISKENVFIERKFREKVEEFLNSTPYFLYRSPTEGNMIISIINVSLTPNEQLGRFIASVQGTAYETLEYSIASMQSVGILIKGEYNAVLEEGITTFGQIKGAFQGWKDWFEWNDLNNITYDIDFNENRDNPIQNSTAQNLLELIKKDVYERVETQSGNVTETILYKLKTICFEPYPDVEMDKEIYFLKNRVIAQKNEVAIAENEYEREKQQQILNDLLDQLKKLQQLRIRINYDKAYPLISLKINGKDIQVGYNRILHLEDIDIATVQLNYTLPVIVNYTGIARQVESEKETPISTVTSSSWDQLAGIFTNKPRLKDLFVLDQEVEYQFYENNLGEIIGVSKDIGELYTSLSLRSLIEAKAKRDTFMQYGEDLDIKTEFRDDNYTMPYSYYVDGLITYEFKDITKISIEAQPGTKFDIVYKKGKDEFRHTVVIGPTRRYTLNPIKNTQDETSFYDIIFENGTFAIVDYICLVKQELYKEAYDKILATVRENEKEEE